MKPHICLSSRWPLSCLVLIFLLLLSSSAFSGEPLVPGNNPEYSLSKYHESGKIGGPNDDDPFSKEIWKHLPQVDGEKEDAPERMARTVNAFKKLEKKALESWPNPAEGSPQKTIRDTILKILEAVDDQDTLDLNSSIFTQSTEWVIDSEKLQWGLLADKKVNFVSDYQIPEKCQVTDSTQCAQAFAESVEGLRLAELSYRCIEYASRVHIADAHEFFVKRKKQRSLYRTKTIPQWPWEELFINAPLYGYLTRDEMGSPEPLSFQLVILHPDIAMEYVPDAEDGQQFKATLMIELLGANFWSWKENGSMSGPLFGLPLGLGVVATYTDREDIDDWGFGGILHINSVLNFGVTFREEDPGYFVSVNIAELFNKISQ